MIINKIINGFVIQHYDTEKKECTGQEFVGTDDAEYDTELGDALYAGDKVLEESGVLDLNYPIVLVQPPPPSDLSIRRCVVAGLNTNTYSNDLFFIKVRGTCKQLAEGDHFQAATEAAEDQGYDNPCVCFDETDPAGSAMMSLFNWDTASIVDVRDEEEGEPIDL